ncbi:VOC family protein [Pectobacterium carotovorum]|uniref:VOC family protein n=1 Tax=Pectobacterium odoriferum TaxID=78398 RepID=UPI001373FAD7|nr:VOC family protein [Pectobacterium odoriferum]QHP81295.1 VOC family protein [Pectobacterium odoriferum]GKW04803.1 virulence protein [Pectobacterium carotovorum subsp. carotovorum]GKX44017.1 virulence protein [Pectobacterium carotovorum subsp. carotovorum]GLX57665.1 virulence protein [Pectobacterium carotovorum subsp. carotovorum]
MSFIDHIDHLVLTCVDLSATRYFYVHVLQMREETFANERVAFHFGHQKINVHLRGAEHEPKAHLPVPGSLDLCFIASVPLEQVMDHLARCRWPISEGPVMRTGATQPIRSLYLRDPDLNLIEIAEYLP